MTKEHDHDAIWLAELLEMRLADRARSPRMQTVLIKHSIASAQTLAKNLRRDAKSQDELLDVLKTTSGHLRHEGWCALKNGDADECNCIVATVREMIKKAEATE